MVNALLRIVSLARIVGKNAETVVILVFSCLTQF